MQQAPTENPFRDQVVLIYFKSAILYTKNGVTRCTDYVSEGVIIKKWLREGIFLDDGTFVSWNNISSISPKPVIDEAVLDNEEIA